MKKYSSEKYLCENFLSVNKAFIHYFGGLAKAHYLQFLLSWRRYIREKGLLGNDDYFYCMQDWIEENLLISASLQSQYLKEFRDLNILKTEKREIPAKNYIYLNDDAIDRIFEERESIRNKYLEKRIEQKKKERDNRAEKKKSPKRTEFKN